MKNVLVETPPATLPSFQLGAKGLRFVAFAAILLLAGAASWVAANATSAAPPTEVTLVARDMAFYLPGDPRPNPTLTFARGERVRLVLRNEDPGMQHDFAAQSLRLESAMLRQTGTSTALEFRLPERAGLHEYLCSLHPALMRGALEVR